MSLQLEVSSLRFHMELILLKSNKPPQKNQHNHRVGHCRNSTVISFSLNQFFTLSAQNTFINVRFLYVKLSISSPVV